MSSASATAPAPAPTQAMPLARWFWKSYVRAAIIPLLVIEITFLLVYWATTQVTYDRNVEAVGEVSKDELSRTATNQAETIAQTLAGVGALTRIYATETERLLDPARVPVVSAEEKARYTFTGDVFHTRADSDAPAAFFSGIVPVGEAQKDVVWRSVALDPVMRAIKDANPLIAQIYVNTDESYNRIYPGFDVLSVYEPRMDIPSYNFYYEADAVHNPGRGDVWTDAYIDPAGSGWMVSSIAPVYQGEALEAVVGIDITIKTIVDRVLDLSLPWEGYALLIGRDGTILALPERGEADFGLSELTDHSYATAIRSDTFKPETFNIFKRDDTAALAHAVAAGDAGVHRLALDRTMLAAVAPISGPGWSLVVLAPETEILAHATELNSELTTVGTFMVVILLLFYALFFAFLALRSRQMSRRVAEPLEALATVIERIGAKDYSQTPPTSDVAELNTLGCELTKMADKLAEADRVQAEAGRRMADSLERERALNSKQRQFINVVSHEFRTPLAIIDGSAQSLERRPQAMTPERLVDRARRLRAAVQRLTDVVDSGLAFARLENESGNDSAYLFDPEDAIVTVVSEQSELFSERAIQFERIGLPGLWGDARGFRVTVGALVSNALRYSPDDTPVIIDCTSDGAVLTVTVTDFGPGITDSDLPYVRKEFYRGSNSLDTHGAGVGLYIADTWTTLHGGSLTIDSHPGAGTRCILTLPLWASRNDMTVLGECA